MDKVVRFGTQKSTLGQGSPRRSLQCAEHIPPVLWGAVDLGARQGHLPRSRADACASLSGAPRESPLKFTN